MAKFILIIFVILKFIEYFVQKYLIFLNRKYYFNPQNQQIAKQTLGISDEDFDKTLSYTEDKYSFSSFVSWLNITLFIVFLITGGFGYIENLALSIAGPYSKNEILVGLLVFLVLEAIVFFYYIPFELYEDFVIEKKYGFNTKTLKIFIIDKIKSAVISLIFSVIILSILLWIMKSIGHYWWVLAWGFMSLVNVLMLWVYPAILAPLFNKFEPLSDETLKNDIYKLANKVNFKISDIFVMDASKRSTHSNAYFTGIFSKKRVVLFDTILKSLSKDELLSVIGHELGHFKLYHIKIYLGINIIFIGITFYLLSLFLPNEVFYHAFYFKGISTYAGLIVFFLWFEIINLILMPFFNYISRKHEFDADQFAVNLVGEGSYLYSALLKLRAQNFSMPIAHPLYAMFYYSHPPLLERLAYLRK